VARSSVAKAKRSRLAAALRDPRCYPHRVERVQLMETHISWVFLTGRFAYKVKKPLKLPFLDFSTLKRRRHYCNEELRLNRRLAPELYLRVVPIGGTPSAPRVGRTPALEYAVKMRQFAAHARLDERLAAGLVARADLVAFAERLAGFHAGLPAAHGSAAVAEGAIDNVAELAEYLGSRRNALEPLRTYTERESKRLAGVFAHRSAEGAHRECHGDLHLQNLLWHDDSIVAYDALEFDRKLREIDVVSEAAFLAMDLCAHGRTDLAFAFLNRYFEIDGDYGGADVLRFYLVYRALVRAKVAAIKRAQGATGEHDHERYLRAAATLATPVRRPLLLITHGLSGSGKTVVTNELVGALPALRVRSDLERKRLQGLGELARTGSPVGGGLYAPQLGERTYAALASAAEHILRAGYHTIVDATFLERADRLHFRQVAAANEARFVILDCTASVPELERRIKARERGGRDASEANLAVLANQLRTCEPLDRAERRSTVTVDTQQKLASGPLVRRVLAR
jgi:aminoglycoside phosphotransferase family enzyme/predicted kinase